MYISPWTEMCLLCCLKGREVYVLNLDVASVVNVLCLLVVEDVAVLDGDVVYHAFFAVSHNSVLASSYIYITYMYVLKVRDKLSFLCCGAVWLLGAYVVVPVGGLEGNGITRDVGHIDVVYEDVLSFSATFYRTLETHSGICALECIVANQNVFHTTRKLAAYNKTAVCVVYGVVLYVDVLAGAGFHACFSSSALHADAVVAGVYDVVDDEHVLAAGDVDGIAVLCVPGTFHGNAVDDYVLASGGDEVEAGTV